MTKPLSDMRKMMNATGALPPDCTIGYVTYYTVSDGEYDGPKMQRLFDELGLDKAHLPKPINPADAWEKATSDLNQFRYTMRIRGKDYPAEILVRPLHRDDNSITRALVREVRDETERLLQHDTVGVVKFYRPPTRNGKVDYSGARQQFIIGKDVSRDERALLNELRLRYEAGYQRYSTFYDGQRIRAVIREYLLSLNAIQLKPSLYFVHASRTDELERLAQWASAMNVGETKIVLIPLPDLPALRQEVIDAFQREAVEDFQQVITAAQKLRANRTGPLTHEAWLKLKAQYDAVMTKANEYSRTLHLSQDHTASAAEDAKALLSRLLDEVDSPDSAAS